MNIRVLPQVHRAVKVAAAKRGIPIGDFVEELLRKQVDVQRELEQLRP